eukprot:TRINITY_DN4843_c0_g1_i1.p1 TRINITY_DN4843_c0_g1~~TRINITY_DN4843_c0_g1_i1.p1  ORF type:complete len:781 (+),score=128.64 TRINITY_DN4843_c0_g1_i1:89-2431(+)
MNESLRSFPKFRSYDSSKEILRTSSSSSLLNNLSPLHEAIINHNKEQVLILLKSGSDPNQRDKNNWTPLHSAAKEGLLDICEALILNGADVSAVNESRTSVLDYLVRLDLKDCRLLDLVFEKKVNINHQNDSGETPLHSASFRNREFCVKWLLDNQANVNLRTKNKETALHFAVRGGGVKVAELLLSHGADPSVAGDYGTCEQLAAADNQYGMISLLQTASKNKNYKYVHSTGPKKLLPQLRGLRHILRILARNITTTSFLPDIYFSLHEGAGEVAGPPIYTSETIKESANPTWKELDMENITIKHPSVKYRVEFTIKFWSIDPQNTVKCLAESSFNLARLGYHAETLMSTLSYPPNCTLLQLEDGYYCREDVAAQLKLQRGKTHLKISDSTHETDHRCLDSIDVEDIKEMIQLSRQIEENKNSIADTSNQIEHIIAQRSRRSSLHSKRDLARHRIINLHNHHQSKIDKLSMLKEELQIKRTQSSERLARLQKMQQSMFVLKRELQAVQMEKNTLKNQCDLLSNSAAAHRTYLVANLISIFPIAKDNNDENFQILEIKLPDSQDFQGFDEEVIATGFGHVCHVLVILSRWFNLPLRYEMIPKCSRSIVIEVIDQTASRYPLYSRGVDINRFIYAIFLLNKNLEQLLNYKRLNSNYSLYQTLKNLNELYRIHTETQDKVGIDAKNRSVMSKINGTFPQTTQNSRVASPVEKVQGPYRSTPPQAQYRSSTPKKPTQNFSSPSTKTPSTPSLTQSAQHVPQRSTLGEMPIAKNSSAGFPFRSS